ncbi:hypothetical protein FGG08_004484 [Glutinoglossum americanum]|uniref:Transmembrane protein n=1 Tax=Glutinoglossum americanum TaxID=1670608 RepID=A0A9P8I2B4_9PEZI|nr:hypothetical protein FGG08_004484 [Glutinoglossum americanum]
MAPKGGGKGGGHGSGGSSGSSGGKSAPTNWNQQFKLAGSNFKKPIVIVALAVICLCVLGLLLVAAWSYAVKPNGRKAFKWFGLPFAITATVVYLGLKIADTFLKEFQKTVPDGYVLIYVVTEYFLLKSSVFLLLITHAVIRNRFSCIWKDSPRFRSWHLLHYAFGGVLFLLWFIAVIVDLIYYLKFLGSPINTTSPGALMWLARWKKVDTAFHCLYLVAAVDVLVCALVIYKGAQTRKVTSLISKYLLLIVAPVLLLRSLVLAIYSIVFTTLSHPYTQAADLAYAIFYGIPTVIIFATMVLIATQGDWFPEYQTVPQNNGNAYAAGPEYQTVPQNNGNAYAAGPEVYQGQAYPTQTAYDPQKGQPWMPPPPPPPGQHHYDTSYQRQM